MADASEAEAAPAAAAAPAPAALSSQSDFADQIAVFKGIRFVHFQIGESEVDGALESILALPDVPPPAAGDSASLGGGGRQELVKLLEARLGMGPRGEWVERPKIIRAISKLTPAAYGCYIYTRTRHADLLARCPSLQQQQQRFLV